MKKSAILFAVFVTAFCTLSCQKENVFAESESESESKQPAIIHAISEPIAGVKSEVVFTYDLLWDADDEICVTQNESGASTTAKCDIFKLVSGENSKEGIFEQQGEISFEGKVEAYYPSSLIGGAGYEPVWPSVQKADVKVPLYCTNTLSGTGDENFRFSSLGAVLQIVFNSNTITSLASIEIKDSEKTMSGTFKVEDGEAVITATDKAGITLDLGEGVAISKGGTIFNIAVPAGDYQNLTLIFNASNGGTCTMTGGKVALARNEVGKLTLTGNKFRYIALPGEFSVDYSDRKVRFSRGNLYYNGSEFTMEDTQYDYPTGRGSTHIGHFEWNKDATSPQAFNINGEFFTNKDEQTPNPNFTVCSLKGMFRILSDGEWSYVINYRNNAESLRKFGVKVCGKANCMILAPDNWKGTIQASYDSDQWGVAEAEGLVCIPPAGHMDRSVVRDTGTIGEYWSSSYSGSLVNSWWLDSTGIVSSGYFWDGSANGYGCAVRLVTDVK